MHAMLHSSALHTQRKFRTPPIFPSTASYTMQGMNVQGLDGHAISRICVEASTMNPFLGAAVCLG
jgi:hypothetical protein